MWPPCRSPLGERLYSRWDFKRVLSEGYVDIIQPDPSHAGGITETRKIAAMAEAYDVALALHCPLGPDRAGGQPADRRRSATTPSSRSRAWASTTTQANDLLDYVSNPEVFAYEDGMVDDPAPGRAWASR